MNFTEEQLQHFLRKLKNKKFFTKEIYDKIYSSGSKRASIYSSPLGPVLANLFMGYYETMWLNTFRECEIILYRRYVDDIICLFNCESDADKFFEFLNSQHPNIKFTFEKQVNKQISFLDVLITNDGDQFCTSVFCKETAIGLFTNYLGFTPFSYKVGLVRTLLHRAFMISSSWFLFHEEIVKIKHYLEKLLSPGFC